ncbi:hypothetical protein ACJX0J_016044 [Zea mays]
MAFELEHLKTVQRLEVLETITILEYEQGGGGGGGGKQEWSLHFYWGHLNWFHELVIIMLNNILLGSIKRFTKNIWKKISCDQVFLLWVTSHKICVFKYKNKILI